MPQPNDLSRSLVALDQDSTIIAVVEMSQSSWLVGGVLPGIERQPCKKLMSKAFVKETDDEDDLPDEPLAIPAGIKNYMTPEGHRRMQDELRQLLRVERPKVVETVAW